MEPAELGAEGSNVSLYTHYDTSPQTHHHHAHVYVGFKNFMLLGLIDFRDLSGFWGEGHKPEA